MQRSIYFVSALILAFSTSLLAKKDQKSDTTETGKFTVSGYIDSYYMTGLNAPKSGNFMGINANNGNAIGYSRAFDRLANQFGLGLVQTKFAYSNKKSEMVIDLTFGPNAELGNFGNQRYISGQNGYVTGFAPGNANQDALYGTSAAIKQAYFTYKATDKLSFTAGQFGTHIGYEVIDAPVNYHYSLSNLFNNGPFYHIGAKANYAVSSKLAFMGGIVNNWDALTDWKTQKSVIGQVFISPKDGFNIYLNYIGGANDDPFKTTSTSTVANNAYPIISGSYVRQLIDLTTGYQVNDKLYFGLNAAYGWYSFKDVEGKKLSGSDINQGDFFFKKDGNTVHWKGIALYTNYKINDMFGIGARYEHFDDRNGVRYINGINNALTITAPITLADGHLIVKPEFRGDVGSLGHAYSSLAGGDNDGLYEDKDGKATRSQNTIGVAFIYKY